MNAAATATGAGHPARDRSPLRAVAMPAEHGGWGLTLEPVILGLVLAASWAGLLVGVAAFGAFLLRTPAKLVAVDLRRDRWLDRSRLALRVAIVEAAVIVAAVAGATALAGWRWWIAVGVAAPFVVVESWFDVRSRGRRLAPELAGSIGVAGAAAAVASAGGAPAATAAAAWLVLAARSIGAIPFVRSQIVRARRGLVDTRLSDASQLAAVGVAACAVALDPDALVGASLIAVVAVVQTVWSRRDPPAVKIIGLRQMAIGLTLAVATGAALT